jgi:tRNA1(Val) A37 N6-methylase TrmN6
MSLEHADATEDAVLGGRLILRQPRRGHRVGHDAILLAAATAARPGEHAVELGAGVGAAGLALAQRVPGVTVMLVDIDPALTALAKDNAARNALSAAVRAVSLDVAAPSADFAAVGLAAGSADRVLMNPPFNTSDNPSPDRDRRTAYAGSPETLRRWVETASRLLRPAGTLTLIWRADGLADVVAALAGGFGAVSLLPVYSKPGAPAIRVLVRAAMAPRAPLTLLPGLLLADSSGRPTIEAEAILRAGEVLPLACD